MHEKLTYNGLEGQILSLIFEEQMAEDKKLLVDKDKCIGCGSCESIAEEYFKLGKDGKSEVIKDYDEKDNEIISEAIDACPVDAIALR